MKTRRFAFVLMATAAVVAGSVASRPTPATAQTQQRLTKAEKRGLAFANRRCAGCHAVVPDQMSPNPSAPPFQDIANRTAVTRPTSREFLRDSHNYPAEMDFKLEDKHIENLAEYMLTLERQNYQPVM